MNLFSKSFARFIPFRFMYETYRLTAVETIGTEGRTYHVGISKSTTSSWNCQARNKWRSPCLTADAFFTPVLSPPTKPALRTPHDPVTTTTVTADVVSWLYYRCSSRAVTPPTSTASTWFSARFCQVRRLRGRCEKHVLTDRTCVCMQYGHPTQYWYHVGVQLGFCTDRADMQPALLWRCVMLHDVLLCCMHTFLVCVMCS